MTNFLAIIDTYPSVEQMISFSLMGFGVVMFVLVFLSLITSTVGMFFTVKDKKATAPKAEVKKAVEKSIPKEHEFVISAAVAAVMPELQKDKGELLAVLTAAATTVLGEEAQVVSFRDAAPDMSYARQGRQQLYASKNYVPTKFN